MADRIGNVVSAEDFLRRIDERAMPRYTTGDASRYLGIPESTIRAWFYGTVYGSQPNLKRFHPIIAAADRELLSFYDIASAHILSVFKRQDVQPDALRDIVKSLRREFPGTPYPLLGRDFMHFGKDVIIKTAGELLNLTRGRQLGLKRVMAKFLSRMDVDSDKMPYRFSPMKGGLTGGKGWVVIDPNYGCGRPVVRNSAIPAEIIAKRKGSGESVASLAKDYHLSRRAVEEAIKYFSQKAA